MFLHCNSLYERIYYFNCDKVGTLPEKFEKYVPLIEENAGKEKDLFNLLLLLWHLILKPQPENCTCLGEEVLMLFFTPHQTLTEYTLEKGKKLYNLLTAWIPAAWVPHIWFGRKQPNALSHICLKKPQANNTTQK